MERVLLGDTYAEVRGGVFRFGPGGTRPQTGPESGFLISIVRIWVWRSSVATVLLNESEFAFLG